MSGHVVCTILTDKIAPLKQARCIQVSGFFLFPFLFFQLFKLNDCQLDGGQMDYNKLSKSELIYLLKEKTASNQPNLVAEDFRKRVKNWNVENFMVLIYDTQNQLLKTINTKGNVESCAIFADVIWKKILNTRRSRSIAIAHNHPSQSLKFSDEDLVIMKKFKGACEVLSIKLLDFLIVNETYYHSALEYGELQRS